MKQKRPLRIGILGFGTVGQGVWKNLSADKHALERRLGVKLELARASVRDLSKPRAIKIKPSQLTDEPMQIVDDPSIDIVCELIGGTTLARELTLRAFKNGKTVVTANKALLCEHGAEMFAAAKKAGVSYFFEASVAGGIPIIKTLREGLVANRFPLIYGILNGTSNYILTRMEREALDFEPILADARRLGYVEADESLDLDGWDAAHKAVILAYLAHGRWFKPKRMIVEGIRQITLADIRYAAELGYRIKLLAIIERDFAHNVVSVRVHPALIARNELMAQVDGVYNGISVSGDIAGETLLVGRGAGQDATSSSVLSDIADAVAALQGAPAPMISEEEEHIYQSLAQEVELADPRNIRGNYYLRVQVRDEPGVLARIAEVFAEFEVSIATMIQHEVHGDASAVLLFTTHASNEQAMTNLLRRLAKLKVVKAKPFLLRVFKGAAVR